MLRVPIVHAKAGMTLALSVPHPDRPDTVLLRAGVDLTEPVIRRLREIRCAEVWIRYPGLEFLSQYVSREVHRAHARVTRRVADAFDAVVERWSPTLDYVSYKGAVQSLIEKLLDNPRANLFVREIASAQHPALRHASNVALLSVLMGLKLEFYLIRERERLTPSLARDVSALGVGAMLHDLGMLRLDDDVISRWEATLDESDQAFQEHAFLGYRLARTTVEPAASTAILHHHQRFDGMGFPGVKSGGVTRPPKGEEIHIFARIVAAADLFDRLRHPPGGEDTSTVRALRLIQSEPYARRLDPVVLKGLLNVVPPFAPGTLVRLSSGEEGVVVAWDPREPCRPTIEILRGYDAFEDAEPARPRLDLRTCRDVHIVRAEGFHVADDLFEPPEPDAFDLDALAQRTFSRAMDRRLSA
ncbi:MAG: HD domain-containing protein [Phycisphaeraceae bacterium]|nr:HD domain-containing protein [Phycisphaeraceae bacterium]